MWLLPLFALVGAVVFAASGRGNVRTPLMLPPGQPPGPIAVLGEFVVIGRIPPPEVILCAIAEAEALGRDDIAQDIVRAFVLPVVQAHAQRRLPVAQRLISEPAPIQYAALPPPPLVQYPALPPLVQYPALLAPAPVPLLSSAATDSEIQAILDAAPQRVAVPTHRPSPLPEVPVEAWDTFVERLKREDPAFSSSRHVGMYRQYRGRLEELGIDPRRLEAPEGQRAALEADLADAYRHAVDGNLLAHVGKPVAAPDAEAEPLTLSGLLGVIQCAGLEGATRWLERDEDRRRFPHTSLAFRRTNGVF